MLSRFKQAKESEIARLKELLNHGLFPEPWNGNRPSFAKAIGQERGSVIAEYKRGSPSRGAINLGLAPEQAARIYKQGGAKAISVLTEEKYFYSRIDFLNQCAAQGLPLLRKDFIFHHLQIRHTAAYPASALLLIVRYFQQEPETLDQFVKLAHSLGLECVLEVFDLDELHLAKGVRARIIQVNNRDLQTLNIDLGISRQLIDFKDPEEIWISASGISTARQVQEMAELGYDACLIGTSLMSDTNPLAKLQSLTCRQMQDKGE